MAMREEAVRVLLKRLPVFVQPETSLRDAAETMVEESIGFVVVRGLRPPGAPGAQPEGVVSERDIVAAVATGLDPARTQVQEIMTLDLASASPDETVLTVATRMLDNEVRHLPILEDGVVVGVVSERDALAAIVAS